jgi:hypothetical protein
MSERQNQLQTDCGVTGQASPLPPPPLSSICRTNKQFLLYLKTFRLEFDALVIPVDNKSAARALESLLIASLKRHDYEVCSDRDQWHTRFSLPSS